MKINVLTIFPNSFNFLYEYGVIGKAIKNNLFELNIVDIRSFSTDKNKKVDDEVYGGQAGMLMTMQPVVDAINSVKTDDSLVIFLSPQGKVFNHDTAMNLGTKKHLILLCGHYEGIDSRVINNYVDMELSIGDYVLTGGEIPAMVVIDSVTRLMDNVLGNEESAKSDSHFNILLQHDHFTRPREYEGHKVPEVLFSGNHAKIKEWQLQNSIENTKRKRPDLYEKYINNIRKD